MAAASLFALAYAVFAIVITPGEIIYGEGIVLAQALRFARGGPLYGQFGEAPYSVTAYTPLYYFVVAGLSYLTGPSFAPGRVLSVVALVLTAALIFYTLRPRGGSVIGGLAASLFLIQPAVAFWSGLHRVDTLALVLSFGGFVLAQRKTMWSGPLFVLGAFAKQTFVVSAMAQGTVLLIEGRFKLAVKFAGLMIALGILTLTLLQAFSGGNFLHHVIDANRNPYDPYMVYDWLLTVSTSVVPLLIIGFFSLAVLDRSWLPWKLYFLFSLVHVLLLGKVGAHYNYFLEPLAVSAVLAGAVLVRFRKPLPRGAYAAMLALLVLSAINMPATVEAGSERYRYRLQNSRETAWAVEKVEQTPGAVISEDIGVLALANKDITFEYVVFAILWSTGDWSEDQFLGDVRDGRYPALLLTGGDDPLAADCYCFSPNAWSTLRQYFTMTDHFGRYSYYQFRDVSRSLELPVERRMGVDQ